MNCKNKGRYPAILTIAMCSILFTENAYSYYMTKQEKDFVYCSQMASEVKGTFSQMMNNEVQGSDKEYQDVVNTCMYMRGNKSAFAENSSRSRYRLPNSY